jgi:hypothetical protein
MLRDPERFHSDGREVMWACVTIPLLSIPILIVLFREARSTIRLYYADQPLDLGVLSTSPELLGFIALLVVAIGCAFYGVLTFGRHGVVITTFGVARVRGGVKKLIRFSEIDSVNFSERRLPTHRVRTDELEVKAKDGRTISFFGFGVQKYKLLIERRWSEQRHRSRYEKHMLDAKPTLTASFWKRRLPARCRLIFPQPKNRMYRTSSRWPTHRSRSTPGARQAVW